MIHRTSLSAGSITFEKNNSTSFYNIKAAANSPFFKPQKREDNSLTDGIKPEYWDFIFESFDPYCDIKLTDLIDLYFNIAENEAEKNLDFHFIKSIIRLRELKELKSQIRRSIMGYKGWFLEIATTRSKAPMSITNRGTKRALECQYYAFIHMLRRLGAIDDLIEIFKDKNNGQLDKMELTYYCTRLFF